MEDLEGRGEPSELKRIMAIQAFNELGEGVEAMVLDGIDKPQPIAGLIKYGMKEVLFKKQVDVDHAGANGTSLDLELKEK